MESHNALLAYLVVGGGWALVILGIAGAFIARARGVLPAPAYERKRRAQLWERASVAGDAFAPALAGAALGALLVTDAAGGVAGASSCGGGSSVGNEGCGGSGGGCGGSGCGTGGGSCGGSGCSGSSCSSGCGGGGCGGGS